MTRPDHHAREAVDSRVDQFEKLWRAGPNPDFSALVPPEGDPLRTTILAELIKVDQEYRWESGGRKLLEDYLQRWPELERQTEVLAEVLAAECLSRAIVERSPDESELQSRFPAIAMRIDLADIEARAEHERGRGPGDIPGSALSDTPSGRGRPTPSGATAEAPLAVGETFAGRYELRECLGQGGMGTVYRAWDLTLEREVALKVPRIDAAADPLVLDRFIQEAKAAAGVKHANVCTIYDAGNSDGLYYISMEFIEGDPLSEWMNDRSVQPPQAAELVWKLAGALDAVHAKDIVHRDIKPTNVVIDREGEPILMDFGLARSGDDAPPGADAPRDTSASTFQEALQSSTFAGTPAYMSPEQATQHGTDERSDLYGLGVVLYELLTGASPFDADGSLEHLLEEITRKEPPAPRARRPEVDAELDAICRTAMAKDPADRYQTADEMAEALRRYLDRSPTPAARRRQRLWAWIGVAVAVGLGAIALFLSKTDRSVRTIAVEMWIETGAPASAIAVSPDSARLFVAHSKPSQDPHVQVFSLSSGDLVKTIDTTRPGGERGLHHKGIAVSPDGRFVFTTNYHQKDITRVDLKNGSCDTLVIHQGVSAAWAVGIGVAPDGRILVVTQGQDGRVKDEDNDRVSIVNLADSDPATIRHVQLHDEPVGRTIGFGADGTRAYVITRKRKSNDPGLYEISLSKPITVAAPLRFSDGDLRGIAVSSKRNGVFVSDAGARKVWFVDLNKFAVTSSIDVEGPAPGLLALDDVGGLLAVLCPASRTVLFYDPANGALLAEARGLRRHAVDMAFSPDGTKLLVAHACPQGGVAVFEVGFLRNRLVFASDRSGGSCQIYMLAEDGRDVVRLTDSHATDRSPRWSPDGRHVAFVSDRNGKPRVCVLRSEDRKVRILEETDPVMGSFRAGVPLDWSPDGTRIAFIGKQYAAIRTVSVRTGKVETLLDGQVNEHYAQHCALCWRRSDGVILFSSQHPASGHDAAIFALDPKTKPPKIAVLACVRQRPGQYGAPATSPDSKRIAAVHLGPSGTSSCSVWLMDADGSAPVLLMDGKDESLACPRWFPDTRHLVCSTLVGDFCHLTRIAVDGGRSETITKGRWNDIEPDVGRLR